MDKELLEKLMKNKKLNKAMGDLLDTNQKLADKYGAKISISFEGKETVIAEPKQPTKNSGE